MFERWLKGRGSSLRVVRTATTDRVACHVVPNDQPTSDGDRFAFRFAPAYRRAARPFGVTPDKAWVEVSADSVSARFGPWRLHTPLRNISAVDVTGPYAYLKTAGPAHPGHRSQPDLCQQRRAWRADLVSYARPGHRADGPAAPSRIDGHRGRR